MVQIVELRADPIRYPPGTNTHLHAVRHLASPSSRLRSDPAYSFGTEPLPRPGKKQAWKMDQPREGVVETSPGPIYCPGLAYARYQPPKYSIQPRTSYHIGRLKEYDYLKTPVEFINGGAVIPCAPRPPGPAQPNTGSAAINEVHGLALPS